MSSAYLPVSIDVHEIAGGEFAAPSSTAYAAPRLVPLGASVRLVRGGGGLSGNDCRYYYYYTQGPYGC